MFSSAALLLHPLPSIFFFFFNDPATTEIYTLSLHDALPICFAVSNPTLTRFFALHYLLPFVVTALVILHIFYLHIEGRSNPLGISSNTNKVPFHTYYSVKDLYIYFVFLFVFLFVTLKYGYSLIDAENFIPANPLVTPTHIQPE